MDAKVTIDSALRFPGGDDSPIPAAVRIGLISIGGIVGVLALIAICTILFFDINAYRLPVQAAASKALGMEVWVDGRLGLGFSPGLYITLSHVRIRNRGATVATMVETSLGVDILPLVFRELQVNRIWLDDLVVSIDRDIDGNLNFDNPERLERRLEAREIPRISVHDATFRFFDQTSELLIEATNCDMEARDLLFAGGKSADILKQLSFTAKLDCKNFKKNVFTGIDLKIHALVRSGEFGLDPITMDLFGAHGSGKVQANLNDEGASYELDFALPGIRTEKFFAMLSDEQMLRGAMDVTTHLAMEGNTFQEVMGSVTGVFVMRARQLVLKGSDLDAQLDQFETSQNLNLIDAGAMFFVGPLGLLATKGYDFVSLLHVQPGQSEIHMLESSWKVELGVARAIDVAMATTRHRIALQGNLDLANERFEDLTLALVDTSGCALLEQKISGTFQSPIIENPGVISSLSGPVRSLIKAGMGVFTDDACKVFYTGRVAPPTG